MSTRGTKFLHKWLRNNVREGLQADVISVSELTQKLLADAKALRISSTEIEEDTGNIYEAVFGAIVRLDADVAG
jgi:hypothetical protein